MNEVTLLQVKTHWSTLKEFDCTIQTKNCKIKRYKKKNYVFTSKKLDLQLYRIDIFLEIHLVYFNRGRISSVGRALDCRAGGRRFDSRGRTNTQGLKITEK